MPLVVSKPLPVTVTRSPFDKPLVFETERRGVDFAGAAVVVCGLVPDFVGLLDLAGAGAWVLFVALAEGAAEVAAGLLGLVAAGAEVVLPGAVGVGGGELVP